MDANPSFPPTPATVTCPRCGGLGLRFDPHVSSIKTTCEACSGTGQVAAPAGWIPWSGGECPVNGKTIVEIKWRNGHVVADAEAQTWCWEYDIRPNHERHDDIIAYRLAAPQSQKGGDAECSTVPLAGNTTCPDVVVESNAAPDVPPVADAARNRKLRCEIRVLQRRLRDANRGAETNAHVNWILSTKLNRCEAKLRQMDVDYYELYKL